MAPLTQAHGAGKGTTPVAPRTLSPELELHLAQTLLWLCSVPSPIGEEATLCDDIARKLQRHALAGPIRRIHNSLVVPLTGGGDTPHPRVILAGHLDTVRTENGPARIEGDRCFGAGAADMKSGLALMMVLAEALDLRALGCALTLVFYSREEGPYADNELAVVLDEATELAGTDLAICLEPSDNRLQLGCTGSIHATVTFQGRTAHSARPWEGDNAVYRALPFLADLAARKPRESIVDGLTFRSVTSVTHARDGGRGRNVVPDRFLLNINHRFTPDTSIEAAQRDLLEVVAGRGQVEFTDLSPAAMPNANHPLVQALVAAGAHSIEPKQAWTDVARFTHFGIPAVNFGPGENAQAHQRHESTSLRLLYEGYAILQRWLHALGR